MTSRDQGITLSKVISTITGWVSRSVIDKHLDIISLKDFGAIGDGSPLNAAVNTTAIQNWVNYISSNTAGGPVGYVPGGNYVFTPPINFPRIFCDIVGDGATRSVFTPVASAAASLFKVDAIT